MQRLLVCRFCFLQKSNMSQIIWVQQAVLGLWIPAHPMHHQINDGSCTPLLSPQRCTTVVNWKWGKRKLSLGQSLLERKGNPNKRLWSLSCGRPVDRSDGRTSWTRDRMTEVAASLRHSEPEQEHGCQKTWNLEDNEVHIGCTGQGGIPEEWKLNLRGREAAHLPFSMLQATLHNTQIH